MPRTGCRAIPRFALGLALAGLVGAGASAEDASSGVGEFRSKTEKWVETRQILSEERSDWDIERLLQIQRLTQELGVNLAGVEVILSLLEQIAQLQAELEEIRGQRLPVPFMEQEDG